MSRRKNAYYIRIILISFLILFAFLQMQFINSSKFFFKFIKFFINLKFLFVADIHNQPLPETNYSNAAIISMVPPVFRKYLTTKAKNITRNFNNSQNYYNEINHLPDLNEIKNQIWRYNEAQSILNEEQFGPLQNNSVIIVIQVHTRITYLRHLIVSLAQAKDISNSLLIFSHDVYDEDINDLVQSVDFCKVMQIFYPHSLQTHPHEFPGTDPKDCPRDMNKEQALKANCNNAPFPDLYGHYREAIFTQTKHHWWWKANRVFNHLDVTRYHTGESFF